MFRQLMKHQLKCRVCDSKQKTTYLFPSSTGDVVKQQQWQWQKQRRRRRQKPPPPPQNPTQDRRIKLYCLTPSFPFLFHFLLQCWKFNTGRFQSTSTSYVVFMIILEVNWVGIIISIPNMREWSMDHKCKTVAVLSDPDTSFPALSFPGVMATVCRMEYGH